MSVGSREAEFGILDLMVTGRARHLERFRSSPVGSDTSQAPQGVLTRLDPVLGAMHRHTERGLWDPWERAGD